MRRTGSYFVIVLVVSFATACSRETSKQYFQKGNRYYDQRKFKDAALAYRKAIQIDANFGDAYLRLGLAELQLGRPARAVPALQQAIILMPGREEPKVRLADTYLQSYAADPKESKEVLREAESLAKSLLEKNRDSAEGLRLSGHAALFRGDAAQAAELLRRSNSALPMQPGVIVPLLQALFRSEQGLEGEQVARAAIARHKTLGPAYDLLLHHYMGEKRFQEAETLVREKASNHPSDSSVQLQLAAFYFAAGKSPQMEATLRRLSDFPRGLLEVGDFYARIGRPREAMREFRLGAETDRKHKPEYQKRMAVLLLAEGDREGAVDLFEAVLRQQPEDAATLAARATVWSQSGKSEKILAAIEELRKLVNREPGNPLWHLQLGQASMRAGDVPGARSAFEDAVRRERWFVPARLALAETGILERKYREALRQVDAVLSFDPRNLMARLLKATAFTGDGSLVQARAELTSLLRDAPGMPEAEIQMASVDVAERKYKDAENMLGKLRSSGRGGIAAVKILVQAYSAQRKFNSVAQVLAEEWKRQPESSELLVLMADNAVVAGRPVEAIQHYRAALERNSSADLHFRLANVLYETGDIMGATAEMEKACKLSPGSAQYLLALGSLFERSGNRHRAMAQYRSILQFDPNNAFASNNLAYNLVESGGDLEEALQYATRALNQVPLDPIFSDTLAWIYVKKQMPAAALQIFSNLVRRNPDNATIRYHHAVALLHKGNSSEALKELQASLTRKPSKDDESKIRDLIRQLDKGI